jgi:hypothetical protein
MAYRGHEPVTIDAFKGLYDQGDPEEVPLGYLAEGLNLRFVGERALGVRYGVDLHQNVAVPLGNVVRVYNYITQDKNTLLALTWDGTDGKIFHVVDSTTVFGPILTITGMEDFAFVPYAGRAYISPFATFTAAGGINIEKGLQNEFLYVYLGTGAAAVKAAGVAPVGALTVANGIAGNTDPGNHLFAVIFETDTGYLTAPAAFSPLFVTAAALSVSFSTVPTGPANVVKRHIVATKVITTYTGNTTGYTYYFIPNATINDNVTTTLSNISFFDADLLEDASHLLDNFAEVPAGAHLSLYHDRVVLATTFDEISLAYVSFSGEPEAFSQIDGLLVLPPDGRPITNAQELRDVLYVFKIGRTVSFVDNDDVPSTWALSIVDQALGTSVHGVAVVNDTGSANVDFLIVATRRGIVVFNGRYILPELSWVISEIWLGQDADDFRYIQILNDAVNQNIYVALPDRTLLYGDYSKGMDPNNLRWMLWAFDFQVNTIALVNTNELIIAAEQGLI